MGRERKKEEKEGKEEIKKLTAKASAALAVRRARLSLAWRLSNSARVTILSEELQL